MRTKLYNVLASRRFSRRKGERIPTRGTRACSRDRRQHSHANASVRGGESSAQKNRRQQSPYSRCHYQRELGCERLFVGPPRPSMRSCASGWRLRERHRSRLLRSRLLKVIVSDLLHSIYSEGPNARPFSALPWLSLDHARSSWWALAPRPGRSFPRCCGHAAPPPRQAPRWRSSSSKRTLRATVKTVRVTSIWEAAARGVGRG